MLSLFDSLYCIVRRNQIGKLKNSMRKLTVESFYEALTKNCWEFGIQYEILVKTNSVLEIKLSGLKRQNVVKFHRCEMVFEDEYERFLDTLLRHDIKRGIYITSGAFEAQIARSHNKTFPSGRRVKLEDGISFCRKQAASLKSDSKTFKVQDFKLYRYLPE